MKLRNLDYVLTVVALLILLQILLVTANAQTVRISRYGCAVAPNSQADQAEMQLQDIWVITKDYSLDTGVANDMAALNEAFQVYVGVYYPNDSKEDAFFSTSEQVGADIRENLLTRENISINRKFTGFIFISRSFLIREFRESFGSQMSVPAILAHEYAHALQYRKGSSLGNGVRKELQADFMAGWYIAYRCRCLAPQDVNTAFNSFYRKGDDKDFFDPTHHGRSIDRYNAAIAGYNYFNEVSLRYRTSWEAADDAYYYSLNEVKKWD